MIWDDSSDQMDMHDAPVRVSGPLLGEAVPVPDDESAEAKWASAKSIIWEVIETVLLALVIWLAVNFATARYVVEGISMEPTLHTGEFLIVNRLTYRFGEPQRGDIIVFDYPNNTDDDYVKRIIGLPDETVTVDRNGNVYIDGALLDESYLPARISAYQGEWVVPENSYFVMGDNRRSSSDSRSWGALERQFIIGKAWLSYWPPSLWGLAPHHRF
jgi:signal peptidase I